MAYTEEEMRQRATLQLEATRFAMFFFSWIVVHGTCPDAAAEPADGDVEAAVREAVRQFNADGQRTSDSFRVHLDRTARATHANYYWHRAEIWGYAADEVQNLVAEELGQVPPDTWLPDEQQRSIARRKLN